MEVVEAVKALNLTKFAKLLEKSNLLKELQKNGSSFTLFAPTNDAFELLPSAIKNDIMADPKKLDMILKYHVIDRKVWTYEFGRDKFIMSSNGMRLRLNLFRFGKVSSRREVVALRSHKRARAFSRHSCKYTVKPLAEDSLLEHQIDQAFYCQ